jgi:hypothetical protein
VNKKISKKSAAKPKSKSPAKERAVIVTTAHRGVFFGFATKTDGDTVKLRAGQLAVYWSSDCHGFMGLASHGPTASCRIGRPCDVELRNITAVLDVTPEAAKAWELAPWK